MNNSTNRKLWFLPTGGVEFRTGVGESGASRYPIDSRNAELHREARALLGKIEEAIESHKLLSRRDRQAGE
jgi:hypothetical protein